MFRLWVLLIAMVFAATSKARDMAQEAPQPQDFAWQWSLHTAPDEDLLGLRLAPPIYARLWRDDLADLVIFNADDEPVPMMLLGRQSSGLSRVSASVGMQKVPVFRIPRLSARNTGERLRLIVTEHEGGRLERIESLPESGPAPDVLLDLSGLQAPVRGLVLEFDPQGGPLNARVDVFASADLSNWTRIAAGQALVWLREDGRRLERSRIEFADTQGPYLRILRTDSDAALPVTQAQVLLGRVQRVPKTPLEWIEPEPGRGSDAGPGAHVFAVDGPYPIERLRVALSERNAATRVIIESRSRADLPWRERARGTVFKLAGETADSGSEPFEITPVRDRLWRVRTEPAQRRAPALTLAYRPDEFVFLTQGSGPFRLAAGSARTQRVSAPLNEVLGRVRQARGETWLPQQAALDQGRVLAGDAALAVRPDASVTGSSMQWLLWGMLLLGAFMVLIMVLRLLRQSVTGREE